MTSPFLLIRLSSMVRPSDRSMIEKKAEHRRFQCPAENLPYSFGDNNPS